MEQGSGKKASVSSGHETTLFAANGSITPTTNTAHGTTIAKTINSVDDERKTSGAGNGVNMHPLSPASNPDSPKKSHSDQGTPVIRKDDTTLCHQLSRMTRENSDLIKMNAFLESENASLTADLTDLSKKLDSANKASKAMNRDENGSGWQLQNVEQQCEDLTADNKRLKRRNEEVTEELMKERRTGKEQRQIMQNLVEENRELLERARLTASGREMWWREKLRELEKDAEERITVLERLLENCELVRNFREEQLAEAMEELRRCQDRMKNEEGLDLFDDYELWRGSEEEEEGSKTLSDEFADISESPGMIMRHLTYTTESRRRDNALEEHQQENILLDETSSLFSDPETTPCTPSDYTIQDAPTLYDQMGTVREGNHKDQDQHDGRRRIKIKEDSSPAKPETSRSSRISSDGSCIMVPTDPGSPCSWDWSEIGKNSSSDGSEIEAPTRRAIQNATRINVGNAASGAKSPSSTTQKLDPTKVQTIGDGQRENGVGKDFYSPTKLKDAETKGDSQRSTGSHNDLSPVAGDSDSSSASTRIDSLSFVSDNFYTKEPRRSIESQRSSQSSSGPSADLALLSARKVNIAIQAVISETFSNFKNLSKLQVRRKANPNPAHRRQARTPSTESNASDTAVSNSPMTASSMTASTNLNDYTDNELVVDKFDTDSGKDGANQQSSIRLPTIEESEGIDSQTVPFGVNNAMPAEHVGQADIHTSYDDLATVSQELIMSPKADESVSLAADSDTNTTFSREGCIDQPFSALSDLTSSICDILKIEKVESRVGGAETGSLPSTRSSVSQASESSIDLSVLMDDLLKTYQPYSPLIGPDDESNATELKQPSAKAHSIQISGPDDNDDHISSQFDEASSEESSPLAANCAKDRNASSSKQTNINQPKVQIAILRNDFLESDLDQSPGRPTRTVSKTPRILFEINPEPLKKALWIGGIWIYILWVISAFFLCLRLNEEQQLWRESNELRKSTLEWRDETWGMHVMAKMAFTTERWLELDRASLG